MNGQIQQDFIEDVYGRVTTSVKKLFPRLRRGKLLEDGSRAGNHCQRCQNQITLSHIFIDDYRLDCDEEALVDSARASRMGDESDYDDEDDPVQCPSSVSVNPPVQSNSKMTQGRNSWEQLNSAERQGYTPFSAPPTNMPTFNPVLLMPQQPGSSTPASLQHLQNVLLGNQPTNLSSSPLVQQPKSLSSSHLVQQPTSMSSSHLVQQPTSMSSSHLLQQPKSLSSSHFVQQPTSKSSSHFVHQPTSLSSSHLVQQPTSLSSSHLVQQPKSMSSSHLVQRPKSMSSSHLMKQATNFVEGDHAFSQTRPADLQPMTGFGGRGMSQLLNAHTSAQPALSARKQVRSRHSAPYKATTSMAAQKVLAQLNRLSSLDQHPCAQTFALDSMQPYTPATRAASVSQGIRNLRSDRGYVSGGSSWMEQEAERNNDFWPQTFQQPMDYFEDYVPEPFESPYEPENRTFQFDITSDDYRPMGQNSAGIYGDAYGSYPADDAIFW